MKTNTPNTINMIKQVGNVPLTHNGAFASKIGAEEQLRRSVMTCMLWEKTFYEDGVEIATRIATLVEQVDPERVVQIAVEARNIMGLRHVPLWIIVAMVKLPTHKMYVKNLIAEVIQRPDEITELMALYWKNGRTPIASSLKKGLSLAFNKFSEYQLAKYDRDGAIKLRDVMFMVHAKPNDLENPNVKWTKHERNNLSLVKVPSAKERLFKKVVDRSLTIPDTWEVQLSSGANKKETFERLMKENKLGALALLRNMRNMMEAKVNQTLIAEYLDRVNVERILPFQFIAASKFCNDPGIIQSLEQAMFRGIAESGLSFNGHTTLVIDISGSMFTTLSQKSQMQRFDAAAGLAVYFAEVCPKLAIYTFSGKEVQVPVIHGLTLVDALNQSQGHGTTNLQSSLLGIKNAHQSRHITTNRLIVITDEQSNDGVIDGFGTDYNYVINVAPYKNGVGYPNKGWTHIDGWSDQILKFIKLLEDTTSNDM